MNSHLELLAAVFVAQLGVDDYRVREAASKSLSSLMPAVETRLLNLERRGSCEESRRASLILNTYCRNNAETWANQLTLTNRSKLPWIATPSDVCQQRLGDLRVTFNDNSWSYYLEKARKIIGIQGQPHWEDYRLGTKLMVEDLYSLRVPQQEIVQLLDELAEAEDTWIRHHGGRFYPAILPVPPPKLLPSPR